MSVAHVGPVSTFAVDRLGMCFRCGDLGHRMQQRAFPKLHCVLYADAGRPASRRKKSEEWPVPTRAS